MEIKGIVLSVGILRDQLWDQDKWVTLPYCGAGDRPIEKHSDIQKWSELEEDQLSAYVMPGSFGTIHCLECEEEHDSIDIIHPDDIADLKQQEFYLFIG